MTRRINVKIKGSYKVVGTILAPEKSSISESGWLDTGNMKVFFRRTYQQIAGAEFERLEDANRWPSFEPV